MASSLAIRHWGGDGPLLCKNQELLEAECGTHTDDIFFFLGGGGLKSAEKEFVRADQVDDALCPQAKLKL